MTPMEEIEAIKARLTRAGLTVFDERPGSSDLCSRCRFRAREGRCRYGHGCLGVRGDGLPAAATATDTPVPWPDGGYMCQLGSRDESDILEGWQHVLDYVLSHGFPGV